MSERSESFRGEAKIIDVISNRRNRMCRNKQQFKSLYHDTWFDN
jgi:hypothetical protein